MEKDIKNIIQNFKNKAIRDTAFILSKIEDLIKSGKNNTNLEKKKINYSI